MSERESHLPGEDSGDESFLGRWSRLKAQAREREASPPDDALVPGSDTASDASSAVVAPASADGSSTAVELPDLEQLDQDSDYSAFLTPGVDAALRKRALRKLFSSPKFNVFDGLDTYRDDFTSFPPLGDIVTADMRHHLERIAKELAASTEDAPPLAPPAAAATASAADPVQDAQSPLPPARTEHDDDHGPA